MQMFIELNKGHGMPHYLLQFFAYGHLPDNLKAASQPFSELAELLDLHLPNNPEKTTCLRKLLEAKDCGVRALLFDQTSTDTQLGSRHE